MRKVSVSMRIGNRLQPGYVGYFHKFCRDVDGDCVAIIEKDDGSVEEVMIDRIRFLCSPEES